MFVVVMRPRWFHQMIHTLYTDKTKPQPNGSLALMQVQSLAVLLTLFIIDILPFPVTPSLVLPMFFIRPAWMYQVVETLYASDYRKSKWG